MAETWHALSPDAALAALASAREGLSADEARRRLAEHGPNALPAPKRPGPFARLLAQFRSVLIYVLLASAATSAALGHPEDAAVILAVVLLNAGIGFLQEGRAERALAAIAALIDPQAQVMRAGGRLSVPAADIVPGDIVLLEAGARVPADLRLLHARSLRIDEAALTGESMPAEKSTEAAAAAAALGDRTSMAHAGTLVAAGAGLGVAVATGARAELGKIGALAAQVTALKSPLIAQMDGFAQRLTWIILAVAGGAAALAVMARGYPVSDALMIAIGLAVAAIPEGLPAVVTIAMAIGVERMAARHAIIRRLPAVETLGSVSVICTDKTGTLTKNEMTVQTLATADGLFEADGGAPLPESACAVLRAGALCNDAHLHADGSAEGDPMETALLLLAARAGIDVAALRAEAPRGDELPFDAQHRFMATLNGGAAASISIKGAPERVLAMCAQEMRADGPAPLDAARWHAAAAALAARGQRVLAFATTSARADALSFDTLDGGATLLGLAGFIDPPRPEAAEAIAAARAAGIRVVMITGDHAGTARAIAQALKLADAPVAVTGPELDAMDDDAFAAAAARADVFARATPAHKLRLVEALQAQGLTVAMTGDGVNDAPALKRADVGVAMGRKGTEAAKQASQMVLADDNFATIAAAVREGRTVYDNIAKVIAWTLPTNGGMALVLLLALAAGTALPITATQILWINMITSVALGLTLAFEPTEPATMRRPPRPRAAPLLHGALVWQVAFVSALIAALTFAVFAWAQAQGLPLEAVRTLCVNTIVGLTIAYLFSSRYSHGPALTAEGLKGTQAVLLGVAAAGALQGLFTYAPPFVAVFDTAPLGLAEWGVATAASAALFAAAEIEKAVRQRMAEG